MYPLISSSILSFYAFHIYEPVGLGLLSDLIVLWQIKHQKQNRSKIKNGIKYKIEKERVA